MTDGKNNPKDDDDDSDGSLRIDGPAGTGLKLPKHLVDGITAQFARWIVPAIAIAIGVCAIAWGISQVVIAMRGATP